MSRAPTAERLRELLHYDPSTGVFTNLVQRGSQARAGSIAGCRNENKGYWRFRIDSVDVWAHRAAWCYVTGSWPTLQIDHIDGDKINNRINNLRDVRPSVNSQNLRRPHSDNRSGFLGVSWHKRDQVYVARIYIDGQNRTLGRFSEPEEAHAAYLAAKRRLHEGCAV